MTEEELKNHLFELSLALDKYSAGKDYVSLMATHYANIKWLHEQGLTEEYYKVLFEDIREEE